MHGQDVVTSDDHKVGTVVAERDGFVVVESGHVFKSRHAIPTEFLHEHDGVLRATVGKDIVGDSPKLDGDAFDADEVKLHYGLVDTTVVDPDPEERNAETDGIRHGIEPAPSDRLATLGEPSLDRPTGFDRTTNSADPGWTTAGLSTSDPQRDDAVDRDEHLGDPPR
ncbi:MAG TPA: hypothetical protein VGC78_06585 [Gaiellaceae bacterium]|jgi:hypothetical protein